MAGFERMRDSYAGHVLFSLLHNPLTEQAKPGKNLARQHKVLRSLISAAADTAFGKQYGFKEIVAHAQDLICTFQNAVPVHTYEQMKPWWTRSLNGESNVVTKRRSQYYALSSGTSDGSTKYVPVSKKQLWQFKRQTLRLSLKIALNKDISPIIFSKHNLLIGGSSNLNFNGASYTGDLSGIVQLKIPFWYQSFSRPGKEIMQMQWDDKIDNIIKEAGNWNVSIITGIPSWVQIVLERIVEHYKIENIHELWPDLKVYIHSGVRAEPYLKSINRLFGQKVFWYESYLASEGFFAFKEVPDDEGMKMILSDGNFYEFVPFNDDNFDDAGNIKPNATVHTISEVEEHVDYALLITTCSGAWRYLIGDTVRFTNVAKAQIVVSGRTKHFLSVTGEHLSVDNMNRAIEMVSNELNFDCKEFTVYAEERQGRFVHIWNIGCDKTPDVKLLRTLLDDKLKELNDDYKVERRYALKDIEVDILPNDAFYDFLSGRGKAGGQVKFPRVLKGAILNDWKEFTRVALKSN